MIQTSWFGQMSLPRELSVKNGRLYQEPVRDLEAMRRNEVRYMDVTFTDILRLSGIHQRRSLVRHQNGRLRLRLILDRFSAELFVNDGEQVLSATIYTDQGAEGILFFANGLVNMDVVKYDLV